MVIVSDKIDFKSITPTFIVAQFTIIKMWKQPKRPSTDEWITKMWSIHTEEYFPVLKKKEVRLQHG